MGYPKLLAPTLAGMDKLDICELTEVQGLLLEAFKVHHHIIVQSRAGTGKSTSIGLVISEFCNIGGASLVCVPNIKLVKQTFEFLSSLLETRRCFVVSVPNDLILPIPPDFHTVIVGEPKDLAELPLSSGLFPVQQIIFDEADELFEEERMAKCKTILSRFLKPTVKSLFLSATFPPNIISRIEDSLSAADISGSASLHHIRLCLSISTDRSKNAVVPHVEQYYAIVDNELNELQVISDIIALELNRSINRAIVFGGSDRGRKLNTLLTESGFMTQMVKSTVEVIPDCDIIIDPKGYLSRGINLSRLDIGISLSIPEAKEELLHQWGRIAREGQKGKFIIVLQRDEIPQLEFLSFQLGVEFKEYPCFAKDMRHPFEKYSSTNERLSFTERLVLSSVS